MKYAFLLTALIFTFNIHAHESDLSSAPNYLNKIDRRLKPDSIEITNSRGSDSQITAVILKNNIREDVLNFKYTVPSKEECLSQSKNLVKIDLDLDKFKIVGDWNREYELEFEADCSKDYKLIFNYDSPAGEYFKIRNIAYKISKNLKDIERDEFLTSKIKIKFPSGGDYYNGTVNVTKGYQWDVVGHEIGHAIYSHARIGRSAGGSHRIDECYSKELALSEGWASFFSAWVSVDLNDPMAKFEYMVPRRAPLEIEHVPGDVCTGPTNEWRVYSFLWDLIDLNNDNENVEISFKDLWDLSFRKYFPSITEFKDEILKEGFDPVLINIVWDQNIEGR
ncbi:hypothetical protein BIY24_14335 [Halobacteriovorax marinus]|uniref:hypothetical protein n=1 Tax=Halobacteriovorax marinus TaxID=97084 RepID=UPI000BC2F7E0|nr:hypothetical protein [Halobacteriovorax marinus]ATH09078.1 hypothetical protein BIY24_14335 [Halobacteriovorax marinus]